MTLRKKKYTEDDLKYCKGFIAVVRECSFYTYYPAGEYVITGYYLGPIIGTPFLECANIIGGVHIIDVVSIPQYDKMKKTPLFRLIS